MASLLNKDVLCGHPRFWSPTFTILLDLVNIRVFHTGVFSVQIMFLSLSLTSNLFELYTSVAIVVVINLIDCNAPRIVFNNSFVVLKTLGRRFLRSGLRSLVSLGSAPTSCFIDWTWETLTVSGSPVPF